MANRRTNVHEASTTQESPNPFSLENPRILELAPQQPHTLEETGLKMGLLSDLALKLFYYQGQATGADVAQQLRLPWTGVVEHVIDFLTTEKLVDMRGGKEPDTGVAAIRCRGRRRGGNGR